LLALAIFVATYVGIAFTRLPAVRVDRPSAAFLGAVAMVFLGVLTLEQAVLAVDWGTIALLLGMMVLASALSLDGHFERFAGIVFKRARSSVSLLVMVVVVTGVTSALIVNDTAVLVLTPLVIAVCRSRGLNPVPFLLAEAMASNIGSVPSVVGNPQNVLVALQSGISFERFALHLLPVAVLSMAILVAVIRWMYRAEFRESQRLPPLKDDAVRDLMSLGKSSRWASLVVLGLVIAGFASASWTGLELPVIALGGAGLIFIVRRGSPAELLSRVDWVLLLFFVSLFVVIGGIAKQPFFVDFVNSLSLDAGSQGVTFVHFSALGLSQIISNVPFTILLVPLMSQIDSDMLWLSLASSATLAGNLTLVGAIANLIVAQIAEREKTPVGFWEFAKSGAIVTVLSFVTSIGIILVQWRTGWIE
jgi:Na+/H+ antiporter NhaD/arsenite permease-like protein